MNIGFDYKKCIGMKVKPRQGDALLFYSMHPNGTFDKVSEDFFLVEFSSLLCEVFEQRFAYLFLGCIVKKLRQLDQLVSMPLSIV